LAPKVRLGSSSVCRVSDFAAVKLKSKFGVQIAAVYFSVGRGMTDAWVLRQRAVADWARGKSDHRDDAIVSDAFMSSLLCARGRRPYSRFGALISMSFSRSASRT
jgi:hypothetical protein